MSKLKEELFPDCGFLERCIEAQSIAIKNKSQAPKILTLIQDKSKSREEVREEKQVDNKLVPLSYSGICDPREYIYNKEESVKNTYFFENIKNPYYELYRKKLDESAQKQEMISKERSKQLDQTNKISSGFFTSKVARSP